MIVEVQAVLANIISKQINPKTDGFTFTMDELKQAFEIYNADMRKADKKYTQYNIPAAYATMLTNKDSNHSCLLRGPLYRRWPIHG